MSLSTDGLMPASQQNINTAGNFINNFRAIGGTNIEEALELALETYESDNRPHMVIFITDGKPTIGETNEDSLVSDIETHNIFSTSCSAKIWDLYIKFRSLSIKVSRDLLY